MQGDVHVEGCDDDDEGAHADQIVNMSVGIKDSRENVVNINDLLFEEKEQVKYIPKRTAYTKE